MREILDSLSLAAQFRLVTVVSVTVTLLLTQTAMALWGTWLAHQRSGDLARQLPASITASLARHDGADVFDGLAGHPDLLAANLKSPSGVVLSRYVRSDLAAIPSGMTGLHAAMPGAAGSADWHHRAMRFLALEPIYVELPVQLSAHLQGSVGVLIDHRAIWNAAGRQFGEVPVALAIGCLIALLAASSLKRQVVDPLAQLASTTRVGNWSSGSQQPEVPRRRNELTELATNFDALADRLADYERDLRTVRLASGRQIIERTKELEMRLRAAEAMTRSKDEFLANMSHEIRTPMNGVLGMAELLAGTKLDKRQQRFVRSMRTAAETMMQIINDILDDSKIEAGKMDLLSEPFDVRELAQDVGQLFAAHAQTKNLELICRVEPSVPAIVVGDVLRLGQVLGNLVSNAVKYTVRGEVLVRVAVDAEMDRKCRLLFSVSDTGPGIPQAEHGAVFEAFKQLKNATRIGGTGLGLSIARRLVQLMGGNRINLRSQPGHGSSFSFVLPFEVAEATRGTDGADKEVSGLRVLVVDDNATSYMFLEEALANWSADVTVVNHGRVVLDRLRGAALHKQPFDLVLLDHGLPDATSIELLRAIRLDPAVSGTYVVLLSAFDFDPAYEGKKAIEPDMCIPKPVRQQLLRSALLAARSPRAMDSTGAASKRLSLASDRSRMTALGLNVLVVDDNAVNREVAVAMLEECRCRVTVAEEGREAVRQARDQRFDVILMDCQMPGMDGYAATAAIRRHECERGVAKVPIVALTANAMSRDRDQCLASGMDAFLAKPFTPVQLIGVLLPIAKERGTLLALPAVNETLPMEVECDGQVPADDGTSEPEPIADEPTVVDMLEAPIFQLEPLPPVPVLDSEQIRAIRSLGKPLVLERLCELLFAQAPGALQAIEAALTAGDVAAAGAAAHSLKSAASNLGGRRLAEQLDRCEAAVRDESDISVVRKSAMGLRQAYAALEAALQEETKRRTGS